MRSFLWVSVDVVHFNGLEDLPPSKNTEFNQTTTAPRVNGGNAYCTKSSALRKRAASAGTVGADSLYCS